MENRVEIKAVPIVQMDIITFFSFSIRSVKSINGETFYHLSDICDRIIKPEGEVKRILADEYNYIAIISKDGKDYAKLPCVSLDALEYICNYYSNSTGRRFQWLRKFVITESAKAAIKDDSLCNLDYIGYVFKIIEEDKND